jgi:NAD(P)-dependent dehydrogenase (short-subunit alcohol dehydrogenase family)
MPEGWLEGKTAVVTGSGRGIGRAIATLFAAEGAKVVVVDPGVNMDGSGGESGPAQEVVDEIKSAGGEAVASLEYVGKMDAGERIIQTCLDNYGRLDIVVNVAGILRDRMVFNMTHEEWDAVITTHLKGHFSTIKPASILMRQQRYGRIINFTSVSGLMGNAGQANYAAAKAGIAGMTRVVARDLGRYGVTCNAISPGANTRMTQSVPDSARQMRARAGIQASGSGSAAVAAERSGAAPPGQNTAEAIAPMVAYLASDLAWNINGQIFHCQGGTVSVMHHPLAWKTVYKPGMWQLDELDDIIPRAVVNDTRNPAPPGPDVEVPGRPKPEEAPSA